MIRDDVVITPQLDKSDKLILTSGLDNGVVVTVWCSTLFVSNGDVVVKEHVSIVTL